LQSLRPVFFKINLPVKETISKKEQQLRPNETELHTGLRICNSNQWKGPETILSLAFSTGLVMGAQGQGRASAAKAGPHPASGGGDRPSSRAAGWWQLESNRSP